MRRFLLAALLCLPAGLAAAATLPPAIAQRGSIVVAIIPNYPPLEFRDPASNAIAAKLGTKVTWQETSFDQMMPSLASGRVDAILSGMTDLATRHDTAGFVDYLRSGPQFFVPAAQAAQYKDVQALCGKRIGMSRRTSFPKEVGAWSDAHCAGKPVTIVGTDGSADARTQLRQGRVDAAVQGSETLPYIMQQEPDAYAVVGDPIAYQLTGMAFPKAESGLQQAVADALDAMIADGSYKALLAKWHLAPEAVEKATINAGQ
jgi:polar amino acid transport system substrate-binding protein